MSDAADAASSSLATLAFTRLLLRVGLLGPLGPDLQERSASPTSRPRRWSPCPVLLGLADADPARLAHRPPRRPARVHRADGLHAAAARRRSRCSTTRWRRCSRFGFLLGFAGASFAVGVPFVNGWYPPERQGFALGIYGMGMGGTVLAGLTAPRIADEWGLSAPFWIAAGARGGRWRRLLAARARRAARAADAARRRDVRRAVGLPRRSGRAWALTLFYFLAFGGFVAMFLYLPKLLTGVHELSKADAGARAAGFALLAVIGAADRRLAGGPHRRRARPARLVHRRGRARAACSPPPTRDGRR